MLGIAAGTAAGAAVGVALAVVLLGDEIETLRGAQSLAGALGLGGRGTGGNDLALRIGLVLVAALASAAIVGRMV